MKDQFRHLYEMTVDELEQLLRKVDFTNHYYADCYYGAYELDANPFEALWYLSRFTDWVDEEIEAGEFLPESEGVWDWMRKVTAHDVAEELRHFLDLWVAEGHKTVIETIRIAPVKDYFYPWDEDRYWKEILKCWEKNEKENSL